MSHFVFLTFWALLACFSVKAIPLWDPTGPYHVGYTQHVFNHTTPNDPTKPGNIMLLTIYYPTRQIPQTAVPYLDPNTAKVYEPGFPSPLSSLTTRLQLDAPTLLGTSPEFGNGTSPYPTVIFLPGLEFPSVGYTAILYELASYGYTIIAIDHPGEALFIQLPNGGAGIPGSLNATSPLAIYDYRISDVLVMMSDAFLPSLIRTWGASINTTHFGIFGHSIGGAGAVGVMASNDTKIASLFKVGANLDGTLVQFSNASTPAPPASADLKRPFLELAGQQHFNGSESSLRDPTWRYFDAGQSGWRRGLQVNGTLHLDYSDGPLWVKRLGGQAGTTFGGADGDRITHVVTSILRKLFGYIEGKGLQKVDEYTDKVAEVFVLSKSDGDASTG
ncbi:hypothetical protein L218DRAFT_510898 [Marasmius fiardii PR-910]|nr:hypothetical protein L218DRAFT_510898 [Marasmius fiardii PR-910]